MSELASLMSNRSVTKWSLNNLGTCSFGLFAALFDTVKRLNQHHADSGPHGPADPLLGRPVSSVHPQYCLFVRTIPLITIHSAHFPSAPSPGSVSVVMAACFVKVINKTPYNTSERTHANLSALETFCLHFLFYTSNFHDVLVDVK